MTDLSQRFQTAVADSKELDSRPDNATMLKLFHINALYGYTWVFSELIHFIFHSFNVPIYGRG